MNNVNPRPVGRPSEYDPAFIDRVDDYLVTRQDEVSYNGQAAVRKVRLPTIEGFARFIGVNKTTLYEWEKIHPQFSNALDVIRIEQQTRLLDNGLSGDYNSTIAKLVLSANHGMREKSDMTSDGKEMGTVDAAIAAVEAARKT